MICKDCGMQYKNVDRCDGCGKPLCPFCGKFFGKKFVCSDCFTRLLNKDKDFLDHVSDFWEEVLP
jgi:hypothetical protein